MKPLYFRIFLLLGFECHPIQYCRYSVQHSGSVAPADDELPRSDRKIYLGSHFLRGPSDYGFVHRTLRDTLSA
jgi:hypothetical protein